jgi:hypothetical protein
MELREDTIICRVEIPDYIERIQLSKKRRPKFFQKGDNIPKRYRDERFFNFNGRGFLVNVQTEEKIIANPRAAGTPREKKISGQDIWSGMDHFLRSKIARELKAYFKDKFKKLKVPFLRRNMYPIGVCLDFYKPLGEADWDLDNHALIYRKCSLDALKGHIEDDSVLYVREIPTRYFPIDPGEQTKIVMTIYKIVR